MTALKEAVEQLPSILARLAFLSQLRDPNSGAYRHPMASSVAEKAEIDPLLRGMHERAFQTWVRYGLAEQEADLDIYFSGLDCSRPVAVHNWLRLESYRLLVPASAHPSERLLFLSGLELLLRKMACSPNPSGEVEGLPADKALLTTGELSEWLGIAARTLRLWAECGEIPAVRVGRQWRFFAEDVRRWLDKKRGTS